jgi:hypothetical protein
LAHRRHCNPVGEGDAAKAQWFEQGGRACHQNGPGDRCTRACGCESRSSVANDGTALVAYPISEAQIIDSHVVKSGAHRCRGTQRGPAAAFAMGHHDDQVDSTAQFLDWFKKPFPGQGSSSSTAG